MTQLGPILAAALTPFDGKGAVHEAAIGPMVDHVLSQGIDGLYVGGSTGECVLLSIEQRTVLLQALAAYAKGRCTLIAHIGSAATNDAVRLARIAADAGYDAVSALPPYYYNFSPEDVLGYYDAVAGATDLPLIVYHIPSMSKINLDRVYLEKLLADDRVAGIKFTDSDLYKFERLLSFAPQKLHYFGSDEMFLGAVAMGAYGGIGSTYNIIGSLYSGIRKAVADRDLETARALQKRANGFIDILLEVGVIPGLKHAMNTLGVNIGTSLPPFRTPEPAALRKLDAWLDANDF